MLNTCLKTDKQFFEINLHAGLKHSEHLLVSVNQLMDNAGLSFDELDLIVCSKGPGSFTGLRIGMSTAKGLSSGSSTPVVSVNILDVYALGFDFFNGIVVPVIDARKNRFYTAFYESGKRISDYQDLTSEEIVSEIEKYENVLFTGPACDLIENRIAGESFNFYKYNSTIAQKMTELGLEIYKTLGADPDNEGPMYIRKSDAEIKKA